MKLPAKHLKTGFISKRGFEIVAEDPDVRMRIQGRTLEELFRNALGAVASYMTPRKIHARGERIVEAVMIRAVDINSLLVEFLSEAIARADGRDALFTTATFRAFGENFLEGEIAGQFYEARAHDVRAVSYQNVDIKKSPTTGLFETDLVLEV